MGDEYDLERFVVAQDHHDVYVTALAELRQARKTSHWMWFVFPQISGLGRSETARHFALSGLPEAEAYLAHPVLGPRLHECADVLSRLPEADPVEILGPTDAAKLQSSMTLFARAAPDEPVFQDVLDRFFGGQLDENTLSRL
jgi:uncharacterized protein (DUF1810 family)